MSQTDFEMEDAENVHRDSGPNAQDTKSEVLGTVTGGEGEKVSFASDVTLGGGGDEADKPGFEDDKQPGVEKQVEDNLETQVAEQMEGPNDGQVAPQSNNEKIIDMNIEDREEDSIRGISGNQVDEISEPTATGSEVKERNLFGDPMDIVNQNKVEGIVNDDANDKKGEISDLRDHETSEHVKTLERVGDDPNEITKSPSEPIVSETPRKENGAQHGIMLGKNDQVKMEFDSYGAKVVGADIKGQDEQADVSGRDSEDNVKPVETFSKDSSALDHHEFSTPNSHISFSSSKAVDNSTETVKNLSSPAASFQIVEGDDGTPEEQAAFVKEVESYYRERSIDFKQPKFYGQPLNCLKLWRAVIKLGGYEKVTALKLWRQVGESFHPPKTCTTVSWTFRIFYEKSLLEFERQKIQNGELQLPIAPYPEALGVDNEGSGYQGSGAGSGSGPGRAKRDSAARAMQGWHAQRLLTNDEDKNLNVGKREKITKGSGPGKQKRPPEPENPNKAIRVDTPKQLATTVVDVGPPADWVKINVRQMQDCFEVYALVPGLLREEVRVQSDPAGRVVITGQPEQVDNPWGITPFKKVVSLPERIDPLQTSAVVSMHGRLFVRVPFEQPIVQPNPQA